MSGDPDPRPAKRIRDSRVAKAVHAAGCFCVLDCGGRGQAHHILARSQGGDDVAANLVCICNTHHDLYHAGHLCIRQELGEYIMLKRPDTVAYLRLKLQEGWWEWLTVRLLVT